MHFLPPTEQEIKTQHEFMRQQLLKELQELQKQQGDVPRDVEIERHDTKEVAALCFLKSDDPYERVLGELLQLHWKKKRDYGARDDPMANLRASEAIGITPWKGAWIRARDKVFRIDKFAREGQLANESVEDSFKDLANYAMLCLALFREVTEYNELLKPK